MKKEIVLLLLLCSVQVNTINSTDAESHEEYTEFDLSEEWGFEDEGDIFLDQVAGEVKDIKHGKVEISFLDKFFIGAQAAYHYCIFVPCQKVSTFLYEKDEKEKGE